MYEVTLEKNNVLIRMGDLSEEETKTSFIADTELEVLTAISTVQAVVLIQFNLSSC